VLPDKIGRVTLFLRVSRYTAGIDQSLIRATIKDPPLPDLAMLIVRWKDRPVYPNIAILNLEREREI